jgi:hypothetical protein
MKIDVKELKDKLELLIPGLVGRVPMKDMKHFAFLGDEIVTYNDQICIGIPFKTDFSCSIPADELLSILNTISEKEAEISLSSENSKKMIFSSPTTKAELTVLEESQLLEMIESLSVPQNNWMPIPDNFLEGLSLCNFSTSKDMTQGALSCVAVVGSNIISSDTYRISVFSLPAGNFETLLLPSVSIKDLIRYPVKQFCIDPPWVHFKDENNLIFSVRVLVGDYPDIIGLMSLENSIEITIPQLLTETLALIDPFTKNNFQMDSRVEIQVSKNKLICKGQKETGSIQKKFDLEYSGPDFSFSANPLFLSQILEKTTIMKISIENSKALFISNSFQHLISLMV